MSYNHIEFHNVAELERNEEMPGLRLNRIPQEVIHQLGEGEYLRGRFIGQASTGCEIRFVTEAPFIRITLSATVEDGDVVVYCGDYFHSMHRLRTGVIQTLHLDKPARFAEVEPESLQKGRFSPGVWRIMVSRNYYPGLAFQAAFHGLNTFGHEVRPPRVDELPALKLLAYGSSITHGSGATVQHQAYIQQTARRLGADLYNKGMGGSCLCEKAMADYLIGHGGWDIAVLELGVNMRGLFSPEEFEERASYLIGGMIRHYPDKPVVLVSIYPNSDDVLKKNTVETRPNINRQFTERLEQIYRRLDHPQLYWVSGHDVLTDFGALTADLIHPSDYGHTLMGQHLAEAIQNITKQRG
ncbi:MAG: lipase [Paenibacillaceae bacterium]|nr:lipase [Paenibacillaceae bacterium]